MELLSRLKCTFQPQNNLVAFYESQSAEQLMNRKRALRNQYIMLTLLWLTALVITLIAAKMSAVLLILYTGVVLVLLINSFVDYQRRASNIQKIIQRKREQ